MSTDRFLQIAQSSPLNRGDVESKWSDLKYECVSERGLNICMAETSLGRPGTVHAKTDIRAHTHTITVILRDPASHRSFLGCARAPDFPGEYRNQFLGCLLHVPARCTPGRKEDARMLRPGTSLKTGQ